MELLNKLSQYNIANFLIPGVVFCVAAKSILAVELVGSNVFESVFVFYFVGMICSRVGSLIIEPALKIANFVKFANYSDYLTAEKLDPKIPDLLETANFYRTVLGGVGTFIVLGIAVNAVECGFLTGGQVLWLFTGVVLLLTLFGYRKQIAYIRKRIEKRIE